MLCHFGCSQFIKLTPFFWHYRRLTSVDCCCGGTQTRTSGCSMAIQTLFLHRELNTKCDGSQVVFNVIRRKINGLGMPIHRIFIHLPTYQSGLRRTKKYREVYEGYGGYPVVSFATYILVSTCLFEESTYVTVHTLWQTYLFDDVMTILPSVDIKPGRTGRVEHKEFPISRH